MSGRDGLSASYLLLIVVLIVIVAAVLFPVFSRQGCNMTPQSTCGSNMKQIGLAIMQYVQDYDEKYPFVDEKKCLTAKDGWQSYWSYILEPYLKSPHLFHCPMLEMNASLPIAARDNVSHDYIAALFAPGQKNIWLFGGRSADGRQVSKPAKIEQVKTPANVIAVYESGSPMIQGRCWGYFTPALMGEDEAVPMPHAEGGNFVFADGHVKWYRTKGAAWSGPANGQYYDIDPCNVSLRKGYVP